MRLKDDSIVQKRKYEELKDAIKSLSGFRPLLIVRGPSGCGKKSSIEKALNELSIFPEYIPDSAASRLCPYICQLSFNLSTSDLNHVVIIEDAESVLRDDELKSLRSWLTGNASLSPITGIILITSESREADTLLEILHHPSTVKFRPITNASIKKLIKAKEPGLEEEAVEEIVLTSGGDARFALNALTGIVATSVGMKRRRRPPQGQGPKDEEITFFHAIARTMHAKKETFRPGNILSLPCVSDNFDFFNFFQIENSPDFALDIENLAQHLEISSFADKFPGDEVRASLLVHSWASISVSPPRQFGELRRSRVVEIFQKKRRNFQVLKNIVKYTGSGPGNSYEKFWFIHKMLEISRGTFPQFPGFILSAVHAIASNSDPGSIPAPRTNFQQQEISRFIREEIEEC